MRSGCNSHYKQTLSTVDAEPYPDCLLFTKVILLRGDATETGRVTDCSLSPFSGLKLHSQHCTLAYGKKVNKTQPAHVASPLNNITLLFTTKDLFQGRRHGEFEPDKAHSTVVGIICPLVEIGLTVTQNLDKARALEALVAVAALYL